MDKSLKVALSLLGASVAGLAVAAVQDPGEVKLPEYKEGAYVHDAPTLTDIKTDPDLHPELRQVILKGRDMFMNTQKYRGEYVFNDMSCKSCHMGEGRMPWAAPVWPQRRPYQTFVVKISMLTHWKSALPAVLHIL